MNYYCIYLFSMFFQTNEKTKEFQQNKNIQKKALQIFKQLWLCWLQLLLEIVNIGSLL